MSDQKIIKAKLRKLLKSVDIDSATQRSIQKQEEIDAFLLAEEGGSADDVEPEAHEAEGQQPAKKKQRQASGSAAAPGDGPPGGYLLQLSDKRFVTLSDYRGKWYVNVREYYSKDGELAPSSKGLSMGPEQWRTLVDSMEALSSALEARDESQAVDLGGNKRAAPSNFKGRLSLDLRECYEKDGELKPGKKGIALTPDQWAALREGSGRVTERLLAKLGGSWPAGAAAKQGKQPAPGEPAGPEAAAAAPQQVQAAQEGGGPSAEGGGEGAEGGPVALSANRRADVSTYQGKIFVNIREYTKKDGQEIPTKKGISLPPDQFGKLVGAAPALTDALQAQDTRCEVHLSNKRKASISEFKGKHYVNIREYYEKDGELKPGLKGISLPADQWQKLQGALGRLQDQLGATAGGKS
ncbi:hypothetical protein N2152v2_007343 [Parachlorella kessleri]